MTIAAKPATPDTVNQPRTGSSKAVPADTEQQPAPPGHVRLVIDGIPVVAPKGELVIRTAERLGIAIPRFCDHPLLDPAGACRQCLVEVELGGRAMPKPQASCTQTVADGMVVKTQLTSPVAEKAQRGNLEFLLLNHPLDCPVCDKGGECPLQNQTMSNGSAYSRLREAKRVFVKPIAVSAQVLLDRDRCVLCQRCTRFSDQIAGDRFIDLLERGADQQIGVNQVQPFQSYFSGNTIQICPVGALTSAAYRFRARPFDLVSTENVCEHCASGCALRTDHRAGAVTRRLAAEDPEVNEDWNCDKGRFAFTYVREADRLTRPLVRDADGTLRPASWTEAMTVAAQGLLAARDAGGVGVLPGGRPTLTDAYAYAKFARVALRTNDIDFRARQHSAEEAAFLAVRVAGSTPESTGVTYQALESASVVLLVALEPEEESPILFLRLRKAARHGVPVFSVAALASRGLQKMSGTLIGATPGAEPAVISGLAAEDRAGTGAADAADRNRLGASLRTSDAVILVGERAAEVPGLLTAVGELADATGAKLAWVPRRAGERGALDVGALGTLLPGGRPVTDSAARAEVEAAWGTTLPAAPGRDTAQILEAVADPAASASGADADPSLEAPGDDVPGGLAGLLIGGVELADLPDPEAARAAVARAGFVVSLELRSSEVTELADVVFPVAAPVEKSGAYVNWEGRQRAFPAALPQAGTLDEGRILDTLGVEMDVDLFTQSPAAAGAELARLGVWTGPRPTIGAARPEGANAGAAQTRGAGSTRAAGGFTLATWRENLDGGRGLDGEPHLARTAKPIVARMNPRDAEALGIGDGRPATIAGPVGSVIVPVVIGPVVPGVVWLPARIDGVATAVRIGARAGDGVTVGGADRTVSPDGRESGGAH